MLTDTNQELAESLRTITINSAYNASRALSKWFRHGVRLNCDGLESITINDAASFVANPDEPLAAVLMPLDGDVGGHILLAFPEETALRLCDIMIGAPEGTTTQFTELEQSALQETGNIVGSAFANSLATWLKTDISPAAPTFAYDLGGAIIQPLLASQAEFADSVLVSRTNFEFDKKHLDWVFLLLPSREALDVMQQQSEGDHVKEKALHTIAINGAFEASRAMSKWLKRGVRLSTEGFERRPLKDVCPPDQSTEPVVAMHTALTEQMGGHAMMMLSMETAYRLVDVLIGQPPGTTTQLDDMAQSCLQETGNIISSSFINSWAKWLEITAEPGAPRVLVDHRESILPSILVEQALAGDEVFLAKTEFNVDGQWLEWEFYLIPAPASLRFIEAACS